MASITYTFQIQLDRITKKLSPTHASGPRKPTLSQLESKVKIKSKE